VSDSEDVDTWVDGPSSTFGLGIISGRHLAAGPRIPWYVAKCAQGAGTKAASLAMKSALSETTSVVPLLHRLFNRYRRRPSGNSDRRSPDTAGKCRIADQSFQSKSVPRGDAVSTPFFDLRSLDKSATTTRKRDKAVVAARFAPDAYEAVRQDPALNNNGTRLQ
jgi:hypothetical protein